MALPLPKLLRLFLSLILLGAVVGAACWPLNLIDRAQDWLLHQLPAYSGQAWGPQSLLVVATPIALMPLLLALQAGPWREGAGSGIPQTIASLKAPEAAHRFMAVSPTLQRVLLWTVASLGLLPLGREGPVVHVGAAVAQALGSRWPILVRALSPGGLLAIGAGAGLAGGFNTPLMGVMFMAEELTGRFKAQLIWPALLVCSGAAMLSNLEGQPMFALGILSDPAIELGQMVWALPVGLVGGLLGAGFSRLLLETTRQILPHLRQHPLLYGLLLGCLLALLGFLSGGQSGGDGEALMEQLIRTADEPMAAVPWLGLLLVRLLGPVLSLGAGIPGGLIDPAFSLGAVLGKGMLQTFGADPRMGLALGMAAGLAGATQLPVMTIVFAVRLAGDQQLLPGIVLAATIGAISSRRLLSEPIYHALADLQSAPRR
ncbi:MAG: chloride channel protein [Synechococcaceae cyanobacterium ELA445]